MLEIGRGKVAKENLETNINLLHGDALHLDDHYDSRFDVVTITFGIR